MKGLWFKFGRKHFSFPKGMQLMGANIATNSFIYNGLFLCKIYNQKLQILHQQFAATINCKNGILSAAGNVTLLLVAIFASKTFAVQSAVEAYSPHNCCHNKKEIQKLKDSITVD